MQATIATIEALTENKYIYSHIGNVVIRKPILLIDDTESSRLAIEILESNKIEFVEYHMRKFEESCCIDLPTTNAPALFAPEGIFRNLEGIKEYICVKKNSAKSKPNDSAYW
jgi:hypothetical protein